MESTALDIIGISHSYYYVKLIVNVSVSDNGISYLHTAYIFRVHLLNDNTSPAALMAEKFRRNNQLISIKASIHLFSMYAEIVQWTVTNEECNPFLKMMEQLFLAHFCQSLTSFSLVCVKANVWH